MKDRDIAARTQCLPDGDIVACHDCDALYSFRPVERGYVARCSRCGAVLYKHGLDLSTSAALAITGLVALVLANTYPIIGMNNAGLTSNCTLWGAVLICWQAGSWMTAALASITVLLMPVLDLGLSAWILVPISLHRRPPAFPEIARLLQFIRPWTMVHVFLLGILITIVKLSSMASIVVGPGLWSFAALTLLITAVGTFDRNELWLRSEGCRR